MQLQTETGLGRTWDLYKYLELRRWFFVAGVHNWTYGNGGDHPEME